MKEETTPAAKAVVIARRMAMRAAQATTAKVASAMAPVLLKFIGYALLALLIVLLIFGLFYVLVGTFTAIMGGAYEPNERGAGGTIQSVPYAEYINEAAIKHGVSPSLIAAVIRQESNFEKLAQNPQSSASGLMQLMPATAEEIGVEDVFDPRQNILGGTKYLAMMLDRYDGDEKLALAAYNAGPGNVDKALAAGGDGIPNFRETQAYVPNVLSYKNQYDGMVEEDQLVIGDRVAGGSGDQYPYKEANTSGVDPWGFYIRQCTSFVAWRLNDAGIEFHNTMRGGRFSNAENWDDNARELGVKVNNKPAVGAVAQWDAGAFGHSNLGHVAYVVEVDGDRITIEEYNYEPYSFSKRSIPASQVSNFIHFR